jgi:hypothetical protein
MGIRLFESRKRHEQNNPNTIEMASSFIEYNGFGIWVQDPLIEHCLVWIKNTIKNKYSFDDNSWEQQIYERYTIMSLGNHASFINLNLNNFLSEKKKLQFFICLLEETINNIEEYPHDFFDVNFLNEQYRLNSKQEIWVSPLEKKRIVNIMKHLIMLLTGDLKLKADSPAIKW